MASKHRIRGLMLSIFLLAIVILGSGYVIASTNVTFDSALGPEGPTNPSAEIVPPRENITVIATDSNTWRGLGIEGPRSRAQIVAFASNGSVLYYNDSYTRYWDIESVPGTDTTVEYVYADHLEGTECASTNASRHAVDQEVWDHYERVQNPNFCTRNGIERLNLTTGEITPVWSRITPGKDGTRYHDIDRINDTHRVVADIYLDRIFIVDVTEDRILWSWNAIDEFTPGSGGQYPLDWTHINDVEVLQDGRFMVSVRNQDQVVFIDPETGMDEKWTLGSDDDHGVLYEQHNPDFIPRANGGPAVIASDSGNSRIIEFQRDSGEWKPTWEWSDERMQWPRDADRLPNGHTLITDSLGDRVFEIDSQGEVVWTVNIAFPYEAERLGTGPESTGGPTASELERSDSTSKTGFLPDVTRLGGGKYLNAALYLLPVWMGPLEVAALTIGVLAIMFQLGIETVWLVRARR